MKVNIFKSIFRNYKKDKTISIINILGLAIGMTCVILIYLWIQDEYSYDRFHSNLENIYRIEEEQHYNGQKFHVNVTPCPMGETFREEFPEIIRSSPLIGIGRRKIRYKEKSIYDWRINAVDPDFLEMFSFNFIAGNKETALKDKYSIVITQDRANAIFGEENPIGKKLVINDKYVLLVTGLMGNVPRNSSLNFGYLIPLELHKEINGWNDNWGNNEIRTYVQLKENTLVNELTDKIDKAYKERNEGTSTDLTLAPLKKMHLFSYGGYKKGLLNAHYVYIFSVIAVFILVIASINFMNLSTAQSLKRSKFVGIKKTNGASRKSIVWQFLGESVVLSVLGMILGLLLVRLILEPFNNLTGKEIHILSLFTPVNFIIFLSTALFSGFIGGMYPAFVLSSFKPSEVLKGKSAGRNNTMSFNKGLVVFQYVISILLIIGTILTHKQTNYLKNMDVGFDQDQVMVINMNGQVRQHFNTLKSELEGFSGIISISGSNNLPFSGNGNTSGVYWEGKGEDLEVLINYKSVNYNYLTTMGIELVEGRDASSEFPSDSKSSIIINEQVKNLLGEGSAIGKTIRGWGGEKKVIGVAKDFHFSSLRVSVEPLIMQILPNQSNFMYIRIDPNRSTEIRGFIQDKWENIIADAPLRMSFIDQRYENMYQREERTAQLVKYFAIMAIVIACLGLFGLSLFIIQNRVKEVGIRVVNGAKVSEILSMLNSCFIKWVAIAFFIACPIAYYALNKWLENFAYKTELSWWIFALGGAVTLGIAIITVSWQSWRAATKNPVEALRYE